MESSSSLVRWLPAGRAEEADLAVLIVSWNVRELLFANIEALWKSQGTVNAELIVIDNASHDGTVEALRERFPQVRVIANTHNAGFARANMQGMLAMRSRHCLLLNPDMRVESDAIQKTVDYLDAHPETAVVGGALFTLEGKVMPSVRRFPGFWSQLAILLKIPHVFPEAISHYMAEDFDYTKEQSCDLVRGSYFAIHRKALEALGGLDTRYFVWFEEVDYCKQAITHGFRVMFVPSIKAVDLVGKSFSQRRRWWAQNQFSQSMLQYFQKWHPYREVVGLTCARWIGLALAWLVDQWVDARARWMNT